jgi:putative endonuclease
MYYFYVLKNNNNELYFGSTRDLKKRFSEHNSGKSFSTEGHSWKLVYYEAYSSEIDTRKREQKIKQHGQAKRWLKNRIANSLQI